MTPLVCEAVKRVPDPELSMWFDASSISMGQTVNLDVVNETPLPFDECAVVGIEGDAKWMIRLSQFRNVVSYSGFTLRGGQLTRHPGFTYVRTDAGVEVHYANMDQENHPDAEVVRGLVATIGAWLSALSPESVAYAPKAKASLINSKRKAKGKRPVLFDWRTVKIEQTAPAATAPLGGTHASPRLHDRRGHWRTYPSGKRGWVKACKVGDASKGVVFKDYEVST